MKKSFNVLKATINSIEKYQVKEIYTNQFTNNDHVDFGDILPNLQSIDMSPTISITCCTKTQTI